MPPSMIPFLYFSILLLNRTDIFLERSIWYHSGIFLGGSLNLASYNSYV